GLQDGHGNLEALAESLDVLDLTSCVSYDELIERVATRARSLAEGTWIVGRGWRSPAWKEIEPPHHLLLSSRVPRHPVLLYSADGHAAVVNAAALALAKLDGVLSGDRRAVERVVLDEQGRATGLLLEGAIEVLRRLVPPLPRETRLDRLLRAQKV